jgi:hypothetical protein
MIFTYFCLNKTHPKNLGGYFSARADFSDFKGIVAFRQQHEPKAEGTGQKLRR